MKYLVFNIQIRTTFIIGIVISIHFMFLTELSAQVDTNCVPNQVLVQLMSSDDSLSVISNHSGLGLEYDDLLFPSLSIVSYHFSQQVSMDSCLEELRNDTVLIRNAQANYYMPNSTNNTVPNDPSFSAQYALNIIDATEAWDITTGGQTVLGQEIVVAVLDAGFDLTHPDINYWKNLSEIPNNGIDDDNNGYVDDYDGWNAVDENEQLAIQDHGTHVAGIIGAHGNNGIGVSGLNWEVGIMPVQALVQESSEEEVIRAYAYVKKMREMYRISGGSQGAYVVATNASFGPSNGNIWDPDDHPLWCAVFDELGSEGILNVNAPANQSIEIGSAQFPDLWNHRNMMPAMCSSSYLIVVANTNANDELHSTSPWSIDYVDIAAPGVDILSTLVGGGTGNLTGTSMSAPLVTGTIALMYAAACEDLIVQYGNDPAGVALTMRNNLLSGVESASSLISEIGGGRLNVYRCLYGLLQPQLTDLELSGTETVPESYAAINSITMQNYSTTHDLDAIAGNYIIVEPSTTLQPTSGNGQLLEISNAQFACSVPIAPLDVELYAPAYTSCGGILGVWCNAIVYGGSPPYTYTWYSRLTSSSTWIQEPASYPTMIFFHNDNFFVKVVVSDALGQVVQPPEELIVCVRSMSATSGENEIIENNNKQLDINVFPNPSLKSEVRLTILSQGIKERVQIKVIDELGRVHWSAGVWLDSEAESETTIDLSQFSGVGIYSVLVESSCGPEVKRFIITN